MKKHAFSLVELVIVIVIIGIIAAIAVPRFSSATDSANRGNVKASLEVMRNALDLYKAELSTWPTTPNTQLVASTTPIAGGPSYGPYLRVWPNNPIQSSSGVKAIIGTTAVATSGDCSTTTGWVYNTSNGEIWGCDGTSTPVNPD